MIDTIIENSYQKKVEIRKKISMDEAEKNEVFHQIKNENYESSTLIDNKVKKADFTINSNIDNLLSYSVVDADNKKIREQLLKFQKEIIASEPLIMKAKKKKNKHLFKGDFTLSEKMKKTKVKEFSFLNKNQKYLAYLERFSSKVNSNKNKNKNLRNINSNNKFKSKSMIDSIYHPESAKVPVSKKYKNHSLNSDSFFITKIPNTNFFPNKTNIILNNFNSTKITSKEQKLRKMRKLIKESNSHMLDIYTGLKNIKQNKITSFDNIIDSNNGPQSQKSDYKTIKSGRSLRNIDKFINLHLQKNQSVANVNRKFQTLFQKIFHNKRFSNEKLDARTIMDPLDKFVKGSYKEIKLDNVINQSLGQRIWIKKSTANIVSYGKSCQQISDDIFYKERKRIIAIYPKIEEEAKILVPKKRIDKRNPLFSKLIDNVNKINDVFLEEYNLLKRVNRRMRRHKIK